VILPSKHLRSDRALLYVGAEILKMLESPKTFSRLLDEYRSRRSAPGCAYTVTYEWFVLAIDLLFALDAVTFERGVLTRTAVAT
jgi:hypothetical protein